MNKPKLQPEKKIKKNKDEDYVCTDCGLPLVAYYEPNGADDYEFNDKFYKCDHSGGEQEYEYNGATHYA